ncbi:hypothetical protein IAU59_007624 [Kwoniella sp. CBS 9459]
MAQETTNKRIKLAVNATGESPEASMTSSIPDGAATDRDRTLDTNRKTDRSVLAESGDSSDQDSDVTSTAAEVEGSAIAEGHHEGYHSKDRRMEDVTFADEVDDQEMRIGDGPETGRKVNRGSRRLAPEYHLTEEDELHFDAFVEHIFPIASTHGIVKLVLRPGSLPRPQSGHSASPWSKRRVTSQDQMMTLHSDPTGVALPSDQQFLAAFELMSGNKRSASLYETYKASASNSPQYGSGDKDGQGPSRYSTSTAFADINPCLPPKPKNLTLSQFDDHLRDGEALFDEHFDDAMCLGLEREFWRQCVEGSSSTRSYGLEQEGSFFPSVSRSSRPTAFNMREMSDLLGRALKKNHRWSGINEPMYYVGNWGTYFGYHLEDVSGFLPVSALLAQPRSGALEAVYQARLFSESIKGLPS